MSLKVCYEEEKRQMCDTSIPNVHTLPGCEYLYSLLFKWSFICFLEPKFCPLMAMSVGHTLLESFNERCQMYKDSISHQNEVIYSLKNS